MTSSLYLPRRHSTFIIILATLLVFPNWSFTLAAEGKENIFQSFRWSESLPPQSALEVQNHYGDIRVRTIKKERLEISAIIQKLDAQQPDIQIDIHKENGNITAQVVHPREQYKGRVDMTLLMPSEVLLSVSTLKGLIEVVGLKADVNVKSIEGNLNLVTSGRIHAQTEQGHIRARLLGGNRQYPVTLFSGTGDINVKFQVSANLSLHATTSGKMAITVPPTLREQFQEEGKELRATFGNGTDQLAITSHSGRITIGIIEKTHSPKGRSSTPSVFEGDLKKLPKVPTFKPGDPTKVIPKGGS